MRMCVSFWALEQITPVSSHQQPTRACTTSMVGNTCGSSSWIFEEYQFFVRHLLLLNDHVDDSDLQTRVAHAHGVQLTCKLHQPSGVVYLTSQKARHAMPIHCQHIGFHHYISKLDYRIQSDMETCSESCHINLDCASCSSQRV